MVRVMMMFVTCAVLFGMSAAGSYFIMKDKKAVESTPTTTEADPAASHVSDLQVTEVPIPDPMATGELPVPFETSGVSADTILRLSQSIRDREATLKQRQELVAKQEERLKFSMDDLQRQQAKLEELQKTIDKQLVKAGQLVERMQQLGLPMSKPTSASPTGAESKTNAAGNNAKNLDNANLKEVSVWLKGVPPELAAESIRQWSNAGRLDLAAKMLSLLEEREVSNILGALGDSVLLNQLVEKRLEALQQK